MDTTGLGNSAMAQVVRQHYMIDPEHTIKRAALERLHAFAKGQRLTVEQASALGFTCETELVSCRWDGTLTEEFYVNFRLRSRSRYEFSIRIVRKDPLDLEVQAKRIEL